MSEPAWQRTEAPPLSVEAREWRDRYERASADGSILGLSTVQEQLEEVREELGLT